MEPKTHAKQGTKLRSCEGYVFTRVCLSKEGEYLGRYPTLPRDQIQSPPGPGTPPGTRYTPRPGTAPGPGTPPETATVADGMHPTGMHSC